LTHRENLVAQTLHFPKRNLYRYDSGNLKTQVERDAMYRSDANGEDDDGGGRGLSLAHTRPRVYASSQLL
jgi:hypothetical protein